MAEDFENLLYVPERVEDKNRTVMAIGPSLTPAEMDDLHRRAIEHNKTLDGQLGMICVFEEENAWHISADDHKKLAELGITFAEFQELTDWPMSKRTRED